jgi:hypothetical protein
VRDEEHAVVRIEEQHACGLPEEGRVLGRTGRLGREARVRRDEPGREDGRRVDDVEHAVAVDDDPAVVLVGQQASDPVGRPRTLAVIDE